MGYRVPLLRGLREPYIISHQVSKEERLSGLWQQGLLLTLLAAFIYGISGFFGIGSEMVSKKLIELPRSDYETYKLLFGLGQVGWGIIFSIFTMLLPALFFWTLIDVEFRKIAAVQFLVLLIYLMEKLINIPFFIFLGLNKDSSLFSFGIIAQSLTSIELLIHLLSSITLFQIWAFVVQYKYFKVLSERDPRFILIMLLGIHLFIAVVSALLSTIQLEKII
ncbi:hypothetical protein [Cytobacillus firmus]|uniref:hypothetical protein n=1 Tax=Cytobacillus firmus TaxID=1399 RepID=UPI001CFEA6C4|nr:hypothetical protein [Cytobacillus firmus]